MKTGAAITARRLLNLYRSAFAIDGEWSAVNKVFVSQAKKDVIAEILELPCGEMLAKHISNLKNGKTNMNTIDPELLPYNGMMHTKSIDVDPKELSSLKKLLESFQPDDEHINQIKSLPIVQRFGDRWQSGIRSILHDDSLISIWRDVIRADNALRLWARGTEILNSTPSDLLRANVQADMFEYETYLPMFGKDGLAMLAKLRQFIL
jgi:hypothetical protein